MGMEAGMETGVGDGNGKTEDGNREGGGDGNAKREVGSLSR
jgi:hypothetical protein